MITVVKLTLFLMSRVMQYTIYNIVHILLNTKLSNSRCSWCPGDIRGWEALGRIGCDQSEKVETFDNLNVQCLMFNVQSEKVETVRIFLDNFNVQSGFLYWIYWDDQFDHWSCIHDHAHRKRCFKDSDQGALSRVIFATRGHLCRTTQMISKYKWRFLWIWWGRVFVSFDICQKRWSFWFCHIWLTRKANASSSLIMIGVQSLDRASRTQKVKIPDFSDRASEFFWLL